MTHLKSGLAVAGFLLALLGVAYDERRLAWAAMALLLVSLGLRLWLRNRGERNQGGGGAL